VPPLHVGEFVAEAIPPGGVLAFHGHSVSGLAQQGLLGGSQDVDPELLDVRAKEVLAVG